MERTAVVFCIAVVLFLPCTARATLGTVEIAFDYYGAGDPVEVWAAGYSGAWSHGGVRMLDKSGGTGQDNLWPDGPIGSFCFELSQNRSGSTLTYEVVMPEDGQNPQTFLGGPIGATKAGYLCELWARFFNSNWFGSGPFTPKQNSDAEAFQIAVWEIIYEDIPAVGAPSWDVTADGTPGPRGFRCKHADTATANDWLSQLTGQGPKANLWGLLHAEKQDYIVKVPEPATIALLGLGALSLLRRRRKA